MNQSLGNHKLQKYRYKLSRTRNINQANIYTLKIKQYQRMVNQYGGADDFQTTVANIEKYISTLQEAIKKANETNAENREKFKKQCQELTACLEKSGRSEELEGEIEKLKKTINEKERENKELDNKISTILADGEKYKKQIAELQSKVGDSDTLRQEIGKLEQQVRDQQAENTKLLGQMKNLSLQGDGLEQMIKTLQVQPAVSCEQPSRPIYRPSTETYKPQPLTQTPLPPPPLPPAPSSAQVSSQIPLPPPPPPPAAQKSYSPVQTDYLKVRTSVPSGSAQAAGPLSSSPSPPPYQTTPASTLLKAAQTQPPSGFGTAAAKSQATGQPPSGFGKAAAKSQTTVPPGAPKLTVT